MTHDSFALFGGGILSALSVMLGFIALVKQKTYIDQETQKPTDIEVPFFGRLRTNYPSLVFVFLGFALAFYVVRTAQDVTDVWHIEGRFTSEDSDQKWTPVYLDLHPRRVAPAINLDTGEFSIKLEIPRGQTFEDVYSVIGYTDGNLSASIPTLRALEDYRNNGATFIEISRDFYRRYQPVKIRNNYE